MKRLAGLAFLALAACQPSEPEVPQLGGMSSVEEMACLGKGGEIGFGGLSPVAICILPMADAGQSCLTGESCESGLCLSQDGTSRTGECAPVSPIFGCFNVLNEDGVVSLCVD